MVLLLFEVRIDQVMTTLMFVFRVKAETQGLRSVLYGLDKNVTCVLSTCSYACVLSGDSHHDGSLSARLKIFFERLISYYGSYDEN